MRHLTRTRASAASTPSDAPRLTVVGERRPDAPRAASFERVNTRREVAGPLRALHLSRAQLQDVRGALFERIGRGLAEDGTEIAGLLAHLPPPARGLGGRARVIDCGGTNIRGALVAFEEGGPRVVARSEKAKIKDLEAALRSAGDQSGDGFFTAQAALLRELGDGDSSDGALPLGYCFSFPASIDESLDGRVLGFTKDIAIDGVAGTLAGERLALAARAEGIRTTAACVENDTVACLMGGASVIPHEDESRFIALIAGTGTNIAGFFSPDQSPKIARSGWTGKMAVNLETAAFSPPHLTRFDDAVDRASERPGSARYEKALSGRYLPYLLKAIRPDLPFDPAEGTAAVVRVRDGRDTDPDARAIAGAILDRSADLVAAGLAAVLDHYGPGPKVKIVAEGTVMWKTPGYIERVERTLTSLVRSTGKAPAFEIVRFEPSEVREDLNLIGAAAGALASAGVRGLREAISSGELTVDPASVRRIQDWARDASAKKSIEALIEGRHWDEIRDAFAVDLSFGTAGLRGKMGVGPNRMNERTVAVATQALADEVRESGGAERGVVVSYDTRIGSERFAEITRDVLAKNGVKVFAFEGDRPMPELSFAIRETGAVAGVMITASHNPKAYNGYKVSWEHGGQIGKEIADSILARMRAASGTGGLRESGYEGEIIPLGRALDERYLASIDRHVTDRAALGKLKVVYDPLYGCGRTLVPRALERAGVKASNLVVVGEHARAPEGGRLGDFAGLESPNPSSKGTLDRAIAKAKEVGADLVLATDPDSDRLVAAIPRGDAWKVLRANETWPVVLDERLRALKARGELDPQGVVVRSWVTTALLDKVAASYGLETIETPTGFKWIADEMVKANVLGGFEESDGMSVGSHTREKCAQLAAVLVAQAAARASANGETLGDRIDALGARFGRHEAIVEDLTFEGVEGRERIARIRQILKDEPARVFPKQAVIEQRYDGTRARLEDGTSITVRPSGTEPKIKIYVEKVGGEGARALLKEIADEILAA